jgi:hypothetical protein
MLTPVPMTRDLDPAYRALVSSTQGELLRAGRLLTGAWPDAETLLRSTLAWALGAWEVLADDPAAVVRLKQRLIATYLVGADTGRARSAPGPERSGAARSDVDRPGPYGPIPLGAAGPPTGAARSEVDPFGAQGPPRLGADRRPTALPRSEVDPFGAQGPPRLGADRGPAGVSRSDADRFGAQGRPGLSAEPATDTDRSGVGTYTPAGPGTDPSPRSDTAFRSRPGSVSRYDGVHGGGTAPAEPAEPGSHELPGAVTSDPNSRRSSGTADEGEPRPRRDHPPGTAPGLGGTSTDEVPGRTSSGDARTPGPRRNEPGADPAGTIDEGAAPDTSDPRADSAGRRWSSLREDRSASRGADALADGAAGLPSEPPTPAAAGGPGSRDAGAAGDSAGPDAAGAGPGSLTDYLLTPRSGDDRMGDRIARSNRGATAAAGGEGAPAAGRSRPDGAPSRLTEPGSERARDPRRRPPGAAARAPDGAGTAAANGGTGLVASLSTLDPEGRALVVSRYYLGLSAAEIGEILGDDAEEVTIAAARLRSGLPHPLLR